MINLKLFNLEVKDDNDKEYPIYNIDMIDRVNIIIGLSGSGKTYLFDNLVSAETDEFSVWSYKCDVEIVLISELQVKDFKNIVRDNYGKLIIIDEDTVEDLRRSNKLDLIMKSKNYFLLLDRTSLVKNDVNINSVFELKSRKYKKHRVFDTIKVFNLSRNKQISLKYIVCVYDKKIRSW